MSTTRDLWSQQWSNSSFRKAIALACSILLLIVVGFPFFFSYVQQREGAVLNDSLLSLITARDVSWWIFILLYTTLILAIARMIKSPETCLRIIWAYIFLCLTRLITISMVSLNPPEGLIELVDPFSIIFYHTESITKDLFFSGHVSTLFLIGLCLPGKRDKLFAFSAAAAMAMLVLIQHIHYTIDVVAAPLFSLLFWYASVKVCCMISRRTMPSVSNNEIHP